MPILRFPLAALLVALVLNPARAAEPADRQFEALAAFGPEARASRAGQAIEVEVDLSASPGFRVEPGTEETMERSAARYPMGFNNITEGWSWRPLANPVAEDYYRFKFLPLQSVTVERRGYEQEDKIGTRQQTRVSWRYDYFLAFENAYDFYPRTLGDDDAGFAADIPAGREGRVAMRALARLADPLISESTTFWKATHGQPVDFTLKKRYLVGVLEEIRFYDRESGELLAALKPASGAGHR